MAAAVYPKMPFGRYGSSGSHGPLVITASCKKSEIHSLAAVNSSSEASRNSQFESAIKIVQKKIIHSKKSSKAQVDILSFLLEHRQLQVNQAVLDIFKEFPVSRPFLSGIGWNLAKIYRLIHPKLVIEADL